MRKQLKPDYDVARDFTPRYNPWDQRLCLVPDGDLFKAIRDKRASVVTSEIDHFTKSGIKLKDGSELEADIAFGAGADLVTVEVNGAFEVVGCRIDDSLLKADDREMLEDLVVAAVNQALAKVKEMQVDTMKSITGGLPLPPGLGDLLGGEKGS
mgnify:CR=1 FL=1